MKGQYVIIDLRNMDFLKNEEDKIAEKGMKEEIELLRLNSLNRYTPNRNFHGKNECFSKIKYD